MRWMKQYDGTKESLLDTSHRPLTIHPNSHTKQEIHDINVYLKINSNISMLELYSKLKLNKDYSRNPSSLFRFLRKKGFYKDTNKKQEKYVPKHYEPSTTIGEKWQLDVKYVQVHCKSPTLP